MINPMENFNPSDPSSFIGEELTIQQAQMRYKILAAQNELASDGKATSLTAKDQQELAQLVNLVTQSKKNSLEGLYPIVRIVGSEDPHYWVKFPNWKLNTYTTLKDQINGLPKTEHAIVEATADKEKTWFSKAMDLQRKLVYKSDFMLMLFHSFVANVSLLKSTALLVQHAENFKELLFLYSKSYNLYQCQIHFNRDVERETLHRAKTSHLELDKLIDECGRKLDSNDIDDLLLCCKETYVNEINANIDYNKQLQEYCDCFINEIIALETGLTGSLEKISHQHQAVKKAIERIQALIEGEKKLNEKKAEIQGKFNEFQRRRQMETASERKQTTTIKTTNTTTTTNTTAATTKKKSGGFWFLRWSEFEYQPPQSQTETETETQFYEKTKIVRDDFLAEETYKEYLKAKEESAQLATNLELAKQQLTNAMMESGLSQCGLDGTKMQKAADALATALASLKQMEGALHIRKSHAINQIKESQTYLKTNEFAFKKIEDVLRFMSIMRDNILQKQSTWLESNRQTFTLQDCQFTEKKLMLAVTAAISQGQGSGALDAVQQELQTLVPILENKNFQTLLYTNQKMFIEYKV